LPIPWSRSTYDGKLAAYHLDLSQGYSAFARTFGDCERIKRVQLWVVEKLPSTWVRSFNLNGVKYREGHPR
jgi:hypothetical protein